MSGNEKNEKEAKKRKASPSPSERMPTRRSARLKTSDEDSQPQEDKRFPNGNRPIWESDLTLYPLIALVVRMTYENFENCLSTPYDIVDKPDTTDHLKIIRNLPGVIGIDDDDEHPESYASTGINAKQGVGIFFNRHLAVRSTAIFGQLTDTPIDEVMKDLDLIAIVAVLQETLEHEIANLKLHIEGMKKEEEEKKGNDEREAMDNESDDELEATDNKSDDKRQWVNDDTDSDLEGEAGYAVQKKFRQMYSLPSRIIGINEHTKKSKQDEKFMYTKYKYTLCDIKLNKRKRKLEQGKPLDEMLSIEAIADHMDYPSKGPCDDEDSDDNDGGKGGVRDRDRDGNDHDDEDSDDDNGGGEGSDPVWFRRLRDTFGNMGLSNCGGGDSHSDTHCNRRVPWLTSVKKHFEETKAKLTPPEFDLSTNPNGYYRDQSVIFWDSEAENVDDLIRSCQECKVEIITCDSNWNKKLVFAPHEEIFAILQITNVTEERVLLELGSLGAGFGGSGIQLKFDGIPSGYVRGDCYNACVPIPPGKTYSLLRQFTTGKNRYPLCSYGTPQKSGNYVIHADYYGKRIGTEARVEIMERAS